MHEALRHHTLLQLKTAGTPPAAPELTAGFGVDNDSNTKFRGGGGSVKLRKLLTGKSADDNNTHSMAGRTATTSGDFCPAEVPTKCPTYLQEMLASPVSAVQRLMAELLGAADEFRRLHVTASAERGGNNRSGATIIDDNDDDDDYDVDVTMTTTTNVPTFLVSVCVCVYIVI